MLAALIGASTGTLATGTTANISSLLQAALLGRGGKLRIDRTAALLFLAPAEHHAGEVGTLWMDDGCDFDRTGRVQTATLLVRVDSVVIPVDTEQGQRQHVASWEYRVVRHISAVTSPNVLAFSL
jgi:hypothetical protein